MINVFRTFYFIRHEIENFYKRRKRKKADEAATSIDPKDKKPTYANKKESSRGNL